MSDEKQLRFKDDASNYAKCNNTNVRINATVSKDNVDTYQAARAQVYDPNCKEIAFKISVNESGTLAIIDTGSAVTVISKGLFERMEEAFEDNKMKVKSILKNSTVKLFSCEVNKALDTLGECDVMMKHDQFQCISSVIVAVELAHD